jgi:predicted Zn-dependent peptidase
MRRLWIFLGGALLLAAQVKTPIEEHKLANGLRVILSRDNTVPVVAVYLIYDVGARSEEKGRTGFAHLFEHMMFQGSANAPKGMHFKAIQANGGVLNGSTHPDYTDYYQTMPSNKLALALWLEADRMRSLAITDENLANQKEAVKQERRLRMDNQPYVGAIGEKWPGIVFQNWHSAHSIIGSMEDLNASTTGDVAKFFKTYYAPNNAVLAIVGDIKPAEAKKTVETYFGGIPAQPQPKHPDLTEPEFKPRTEIFRDPLARVPAVVLGYPGPKRRSPDYYAMVMLDAVLTGGESSRFQQELVKGKQSVLQVNANPGWPTQDATDYKDPNVYAMLFVYKPNFSGNQIAGQAQEVIDNIAQNGVPGGELDRVRTFVRSARLNEIQSAMNRAQLLGKYAVLDGDPNMINVELEKFLAVTPARIQTFAKQYLRAERRTMLDIVPAPKGPASWSQEGV